MPSLRLMRDAELPDILSLLDTGTGTARSLASWNQDRMTALVMESHSGVPTAAMPMSRRQMTVAPGREASVGWLSSNQFASRMSLRRQTRDTAAQWPELLPDLDALIVVRRDESSLAGRWYTQTGFHDLLSIRCLYLDMQSPTLSRPPETPGRYHVRLANPLGNGSSDAWDAERWQAEMLAVYRDVYASTGGGGGAVVRTPKFWQNVLAHHYYSAHYQFQIVGLWNADPVSPTATLMGYAIVGWSGWHSKRPRMDILELATRQWDTTVASELLRTTCQLAWSKNVHQVRAVISAHDPYRAHLTRSGFVDKWGYVLSGKWLNPQRYIDRIAVTFPVEAAGLNAEIHCAGQLPLRIRAGTNIAATISALPFQADARTLTRLLFNRLDISAALRGADESSLLRVSAPDSPQNRQDLTRLALAFPWTPWVFHMLDFI